MNSASRPACDISNTYYHTSHTPLANSHKQVPVENNCVYVCVLCELGLSGIREHQWSPLTEPGFNVTHASSLLPLPCPHYTQPSGALQLCLQPAPAPLTFLDLLVQKPTCSCSFSLSHHLLALSCKSNNNVSVLLFMLIYPVRCVENMYIFVWAILCVTHLRIVTLRSVLYTKTFYYCIVSYKVLIWVKCKLSEFPAS